MAKIHTYIDDIIKEMSTEHEEAVAFNMPAYGFGVYEVNTYVTNGKLIVNDNTPAFLEVKRIDFENRKTYNEKLPVWVLATYEPLDKRLQDIVSLFH